MTSVIANNNPPSPEEQFKTDLGELKIDLDYLHSKPQIFILKHLQKLGFSAAPKHRNLPILNDLIFLILGHLRSTNFESFRVAQNQLLKMFEYRDSLYQNTLYAFMQQFTEDFNQLPEAERKSNEMQTLVDDLASKGLITENPDGIGVSPYQSQFANALDGLTMPGERKWISKVLDPAIKAAESTL